MCYVLETVKVLFKIGGITHNVQLMCAFIFFLWYTFYCVRALLDKRCYTGLQSKEM